jgi:hypothetical protein
MEAVAGVIAEQRTGATAVIPASLPRVNILAAMVSESLSCTIPNSSFPE